MFPVGARGGEIKVLCLCAIAASTLASTWAPSIAAGQTEARPQIRDRGVRVGVLQRGPLNAITDVAGVKRILDYDTNGKVHHNNYFRQIETIKFFAETLLR